MRKSVKKGHKRQQDRAVAMEHSPTFWMLPRSPNRSILGGLFNFNFGTRDRAYSWFVTGEEADRYALAADMRAVIDDMWVVYDKLAREGVDREQAANTRSGQQLASTR